MAAPRGGRSCCSRFTPRARPPTAGWRSSLTPQAGAAAEPKHRRTALAGRRIRRRAVCRRACPIPKSRTDPRGKAPIARRIGTCPLTGWTWRSSWTKPTGLKQAGNASRRAGRDVNRRRRRVRHRSPLASAPSASSARFSGRAGLIPRPAPAGRRRPASPGGERIGPSAWTRPSPRIPSG